MEQQWIGIALELFQLSIPLIIKYIIFSSRKVMRFSNFEWNYLKIIKIFIENKFKLHNFRLEIEAKKVGISRWNFGNLVSGLQSSFLDLRHFHLMKSLGFCVNLIYYLRRFTILGVLESSDLSLLVSTWLPYRK
jgi:hypothetical protein